jgi:type IV pilus assembly protein PilM
MIKRQAKRGTNVFIQLNEQDTLISILRDEVLILQRTVGYGFSALIDAVMEQEILKVSTKEEAVQLLMKKNLLTLEQEPKQPELEFDASWTKGEAAAASEYVRAMNMSSKPEEDPEIEARRNIRESLHFLTSSIARMLDYYKSNHKETYFDMVYLCGTGIHTKGMDTFFQSEIGITHKRMEKLWTVSANKKAAAYRSNSSEFMSCIGAVIKPLDFVPVEFLEKKQKRSAVIATVVFATVCLLGSAGIIYISSLDYQAAIKEQNTAKAQYEAMPQLSDSFSKYDQSVKELEDLQKLEDMTKSNNDLIKEVIGELEKKLPTGTIINSMQFAETGVTMNVTVNDNSIGPNAMIAKLLIQLKTIKYFQNADISGISSSQENGITNVNFTITCTYSEVN